MINRGPGFLAVVWFDSSPTPSPLSRQQVVSLSQSSCVSPIELTDGRGGRGWGRSQNIRKRECLILYKSFNSIWFVNDWTVYATKELDIFWPKFKFLNRYPCSFSRFFVSCRVNLNNFFCRFFGRLECWSLLCLCRHFVFLKDVCARIYRPSFHENKPKTLVFSHTKRAFWACFRENWVYNFGHWIRS